MTIGEIIQRIQSLYSKGVQSDDTRLSSRHIFNKIVTIRSKLVSQELKKRQKVSQWTYQTLNCVELVKALPHECPCIPPVGCEIMRTKNPIPRPLTNYDSHIIQSVTSVDGTVIFSEMGWNEKKYRKGNKFTKHKPDFYIRNNYIYVTHEIGLKLISITGVFDNPLDVYNFPSLCPDCPTCNCTSPLDMEFPIDNDLIDTLIDMCVPELVQQFSQMVEDKTNNSADSPAENSK